ncbi:T9SS type A sorting domain-containing protein [Spirosoma sp. BT702]|uniref:T9SS type A sorting domain-containing protein n=1 Tax=Spirosoma profusum TaxID=2771354 RepID=A0A927AR31_9BACT|nr:T9SS type A sorting domain-containing protein [Spirosoma profusum]MBD2701636.1 T9SS type A sorting domain-containing protein [Spirosoma profusum]
MKTNLYQLGINKIDAFYWSFSPIWLLFGKPVKQIGIGQPNALSTGGLLSILHFRFFTALVSLLLIHSTLFATNEPDHKTVYNPFALSIGVQFQLLNETDEIVTVSIGSSDDCFAERNGAKKPSVTFTLSPMQPSPVFHYEVNNLKCKDAGFQVNVSSLNGSFNKIFKFKAVISPSVGLLNLFFEPRSHIELESSSGVGNLSKSRVLNEFGSQSDWGKGVFHLLKDEPWADWMNNSGLINSDKTLSQIVVPGSHDAGMYKIGTSYGGVSANTQTQSLDIVGQLNAGVRYFDCRVLAKDFAQNPIDFPFAHLNGSKYCFPNLTVNDKNEALKAIEDLTAFLANVATDLGTSNVLKLISDKDAYKSAINKYNLEVGATSDNLPDVLTGINNFLSNHKELVILNFGSLCTDDGQFDRLRSVIRQRIDASKFVSLPNLFTGNVTLKDIFAGSNTGKLIIRFETQTWYDVNNPSAAAANQGFYSQNNISKFDSYSNKNDLSTMAADQLGKLANLGNYSQNLFLLSWTLTQQGGGDAVGSALGLARSIRAMATQANNALSSQVAANLDVMTRALPYKDQNGNEFIVNKPNILHIDDSWEFVTSICLYLNKQRVSGLREPAPATPLTLVEPLYNCQTGEITFQYHGGNGTPVTYSVPGVLRSSPTSTTGIVEAELRADPKPITIRATQGKSTVSYVFDFRHHCIDALPVDGKLTLLQPLYDCQTGFISLQSAGGDGTPITYSIPGVLRSSPASTTGIVEADLRNDPKPITIQATQSGKTVDYVFSFGEHCNTSLTTNARIGLETLSEQNLSIRVFGNPNTAESIEIEVRGVDGKSFNLQVLDNQGRVFDSQLIKSDAINERQIIQLGKSPGLYLLQVTTNKQSKTVKLIKQ